MYRLKPLDRFKLQQDRILNQEIGSKANLDEFPSVRERYWALAVKS
jgi:hypothetical protein